MIRCKHFLLWLLAPLLVPTATAQEISHYMPLVEAELFGVDVSHSTLAFSVGFMGLSEVQGQFRRYDAAILYDPDDVTRTSVTLRIPVKSIDTNSRWRDEDLQSERFFDAENHPDILFQSTRIEQTADGLVLHGTLTMRGVTKALAIPIEQTTPRVADPGWGNIRLGFAGTLTLNRTDYGIHGGDFWGIEAVSDEVQITFSLLGTIMNMSKIVFNAREKPSIGEVLLARLDEAGLDAALATYQQLRSDEPEAYNFAESQLNRLGYKLIQQQRLAEATAVLALNAEAYPESADAHSSLGEAYAIRGERAAAVAHFQQALALDAGNVVALEVLRHLE